MKLRETDILRTACEIHVGPNGMFAVYLAGRADEEDAKALSLESTLEAAVEKAKPAIRARRVRVSVPFYETHSLKRRTAVGFHAGTGNVILDDGGQVGGYGSTGRGLRGDMPKVERTRLETLREEVDRRNKEINNIEKEYNFEIAPAVQQAIDEKQDSTTTTEED